MLTVSKGLFNFSYCPASEEAGGTQKLGGETARTADLNWPKGCPIPGQVWAAAWGQAGHQLGGGQQLFFTCFTCLS